MSEIHCLYLLSTQLYQVTAGFLGELPSMSVVVYLNMGFFLGRLLHLAIIHEAKDYVRTMIDVSKNTDFLNTQNDLRQVSVPPSNLPSYHLVAENINSCSVFHHKEK